MKRERMGRVSVFTFLIFLSGCASLVTERIQPPAFPNNEGVHYLQGVPPVAQTAYQCGPAALESAIRRWGQEADAGEIGRVLYKRGTRGILNFTLAQYARDRGFWTEIREGNPKELRTWLQREIPPIVMLHVGPFWSPTYHFVVLKGFNDREQIFYANTGHPETRAIRYPNFLKRWGQAHDWTLILCPPERVNWELKEDEALGLALLLEHKGRLDLAEQWVHSALVKNPSSVPARFNLANLYLKTNRLKEAKTIYRELLKAKPDWAPASNNLAWIYLEEGKAREAIRVIDATLQMGAPRRYDILDTLGFAYCKLKHYEKGRACLLEAVEKVPPENSEAVRLIQNHLDECHR